ncbi:DMT family transporter [Peteryoungia desertarenae]|uniref:DMT family transporter n=1 Tax=Peteryoungia desertarenae TaxID=1813451 RepID=A0ABX6QQL9_9HYPH|nr:DMT family transporter [Peteryoungia desertarenae]QLF70450.1 DMT family transporter [Peteryoungia desertarenae]
MDHSSQQQQPGYLDWFIYVLTPLFFSSNIIFGRGLAGESAPFTTAFLRWLGAAILVAPFLYADRRAAIGFVRSQPALWLWLGILGMGICGGVVYWALIYTTATNATLIYTTSPLFILVLQWLRHGRAIAAREFLGMALAFAGVGVIVFKGQIAALASFEFNFGDLGILVAAIAFAIYSLALRGPAPSQLKPMTVFGILAVSGAVVLVPPATYEIYSGAPLPDAPDDWVMLAGMVVFASLAAFYCYHHTVHALGATLAGTTLYLMPPMSIILAVLFLDETIEFYHVGGVVLVMGGLLLATAPKNDRRRTAQGKQ